MSSTSILRSIGPGLLFAGAAIGVSHLVQSTRAGADFGFGLLWALLLVHICKYPFFEFGPRYASATGETLLEGYKKLGKGVLVAYFVLNIATMFTIQAAVTVVTAGLAVNLFGLSDNLVVWSIVITLVSLLILVIGRYKLLDKLMKLIIVALSISTLLAVAFALDHNSEPVKLLQILPESALEVSFLIAFLGWMPAPLDISIWHSIWSVEKEKVSLSKIPVQQSLFDFNVGYVGALFLGVCFLVLGALVMYPSGTNFSSSGSVFANQLIYLYTKTLGNETHIIIAVAAFTTMFSTTLTCLDASPRAMELTTQLIIEKKNKLSYWFWIVLIAVGTFIILQFYSANMGLLVTIATILSFLTAPFYAILNFWLIQSRYTPEEHRPKPWLKILSYLGILFLFSFSIWYLSTLLLG